jgi:hypothetical protein
MPPLALACPYCSQPITAESAASAQVVACPHCQRPVTIPPPLQQENAAPSHVNASAAPPPAALKPPPPPRQPRAPFDFQEPAKVVLNRRGEPIELRRRTPEERARYRRRFNWIFAIIGMTLLAIALAVLLQWQP